MLPGIQMMKGKDSAPCRAVSVSSNHSDNLLEASDHSMRTHTREILGPVVYSASVIVNLVTIALTAVATILRL